VAARYPSLQQESRILSWVAAQGYPAPAMLELIPPGELFDSPVQVMRRLPGTTMAQAMTSAPWQVTRWARRLAAAHAALHRLPVPDWPDRGRSLAEQRLGLTRRMVARDPDSGLAKALERIEPILPRLDVGSPTVCHGDFHPANLLVEAGTVEAGTVAAIDWTDAGIGDRHGDIARTAWLFSFAAVVARSGRERLVLRALAPPLSRAHLTPGPWPWPENKDSSDHPAAGASSALSSPTGPSGSSGCAWKTALRRGIGAVGRRWCGQ
jgi:aminoglycoside phosphotransferase (APT) family kinase protein